MNLSVFLSSINAYPSPVFLIVAVVSAPSNFFSSLPNNEKLNPLDTNPLLENSLSKLKPNSGVI